MRPDVAAFICFATAVALLLWKYPWSVTHGAFTFRVRTTVLAYAVTGLLMTGITAAAYAVVIRFRQGRRLMATWALPSLLSPGVFVCVALTLGPGGAAIWTCSIL
jgi:hypothetical protein